MECTSSGRKEPDSPRTQLIKANLAKVQQAALSLPPQENDDVEVHANGTTLPRSPTAFKNRSGFRGVRQVLKDLVNDCPIKSWTRTLDTATCSAAVQRQCYLDLV